ncbi:helix-turn-helix domain-containing protein [Streptomyces capoamus]|uniref:helix-turn-helix domain-containing protein n=1 Tax=Streptomyces capoamus TaxID=68183 RepID=UPI0033997C88
MDKRSLAQLAGRFRDAEARTEILRQELAVAIAQADADGVAQKDICEATGYTRQQVRRIVKAANADSDGEQSANSPQHDEAR